MSDYNHEFRKFMRIRNWFLLFWVGFIPFVVITFGKSEEPFTKMDTKTVLISAWVVAFMYFAIRLAFWRCPQCGKRFLPHKWYGPDLGAWECGHCGLQRPSFRKTAR